MEITQTANIEKILKKLHHPKQGERPDGNVSAGRELSGTARNQDLRHVATVPQFVVLDAIAEEHGEASHKGKGQHLQRSL